MSRSSLDEKKPQLLLQHAVMKQIKLREQIEWKQELPCRCPPILWFGNAESKKPVVCTVGANPSRKEYLYDSSKQASINIRNNKSLNYREYPNNRLRLLNQTEELDDIYGNTKLQKEIIAGYNSYFLNLCNNKKHLAYTRWFGMNKSDSYNVEGFLRGFNASYYQNDDLDFQAIHIDLFPFATLSDFKDLLKNKNINKKDLFGNEWAANLIQSLLTMLQPSLLIIFGRTNFDYFSRYVDNSISQARWQGYGCTSYCMGNGVKIELPFIGLSTNLGNPRGFTAKCLNQHGQYIRKEVQHFFQKIL